MFVNVLLYDSGKDSEGIHSLELRGSTIVLMFENKDDADRYCGLLEAQDFPRPTVESLERDEIERFCKEAGYEARFVSSGFVPQTEEERLLLSPPQTNRQVGDWDKLEEALTSTESESIENINVDQLDDIRKRLEGLL